MKEPKNWNEDDLLQLIAEKVKEGIELDYKRSDSLEKTERRKDELSKDVSAFANSGCGVLVYGVTEDGHVPTGIDAGSDPNVISKEWLEQVINSRIQRRIPGIKINQIVLPKSAPGRAADVVAIPQSLLAPHQAADKRFYKKIQL